jgi:hypothetical protein
MTPYCDTRTSVTCHRYVASDALDELGYVVPKRTKKDKNYRKYSSGFNGNITDSWM